MTETPENTDDREVQLLRIDGAELAVRLAEAMYEMPRPEGSTAGQALMALEPRDREMLIRGAQVAAEYVCSQINGRETKAIKIEGGIN